MNVTVELYPKVSIDVFMPELQLEIPELPDDILMAYIRRAAIDFCERSRCLTREVTFCTIPCIQNYLLESPDCMRIIAVNGVRRECGGGYVRLNDKPSFIGIMDAMAWWDQLEGSIVINPAPATESRLVVRVSVAPEQDACELDAALYDKYREAILAGTRAFLYDIPRRPWTNQNIALAARQEFDRRISAAGIDRLMNGQQGTMRMRGIFNRH